MPGMASHGHLVPTVFPSGPFHQGAVPGVFGIGQAPCLIGGIAKRRIFVDLRVNFFEQGIRRHVKHLIRRQQDA